MVVKAINYKNWCTDNISPQSWPRVLLKCVDMIREKGKVLADYENPSDDLALDPELLDALNKALQELYEMTVEESLLVKY